MVKSLFAGLILALCYLLKCLAPPLIMHQNRACSKKGQVLSEQEAEQEAEREADGQVKGEVEGGFEGGLDVEALKGPQSLVQRGTRRNA